MKALSIRQPWAWLLLKGIKDIENRTWRTNHRGPFLIHASKKFDTKSIIWIYDNFPSLKPELDPYILHGCSRVLDCGGIIGIADLIDCVEWSDSPWYTGNYGFVVHNIRPLQFHECKGQLGFFNINYKI